MRLNHVLLRTRDCDAMTAFFVDAVGLKSGWRPPFAFDGAWIYSGSRPIIHLVDSNPSDAEQAAYLGSSTSDEGTGIVDHIALGGDDYPGLIKRLKQLDYEYFERTVPATGEHQVFIVGPEGLKVEMVFDEHKQVIGD